MIAKLICYSRRVATFWLNVFDNIIVVATLYIFIMKLENLCEIIDFLPFIQFPEVKFSKWSLNIAMDE